MKKKVCSRQFTDDSKRATVRSVRLSTGFRGFTVLYAALVSSLLLAVGMVIFDITYKEVVFSSVARDSNFAFYAADTGIECALYWDFKYTGTANFGSGSIFATSTDSTSPPPPGTIYCNGVDIVAGPPAWTVAKSATSATTQFRLTFLPQPYCADVTVVKSASPKVTTVVTARGYNTCSSTDPNRIERALQSNY